MPNAVDATSLCRIVVTANRHNQIRRNRMGWKSVRSNVKFVVNYKPFATAVLVGAGFAAGWFAAAMF